MAYRRRRREDSGMTTAAPPRLFVPDDLAPGSAPTLSPEQSHYLINVMRRGAGDPVLLFNGRHGEWLARIESAKKRGLALRLEQATRPQGGPPDLWLLFAPIKRQRIDFIAEKATELGVAVIWPVITRRTIIERVNLERLRAHAVEAAEQCGLLAVPELREPVELDEVLDRWDPTRRILYCDESGTAPSAKTALAGERRGPWAVLIGPEGGFDPAEQKMLRAHPASLAVSLGPRIMRADTAAIAALALWQSALGDWDTPPQPWQNPI
jgi:16S rRNA (uracil1498-N3)-methyltransferase